MPCFWDLTAYMFQLQSDVFLRTDSLHASWSAIGLHVPVSQPFLFCSWFHSHCLHAATLVIWTASFLDNCFFLSILHDFTFRMASSKDIPDGVLRHSLLFFFQTWIIKAHAVATPSTCQGMKQWLAARRGSGAGGQLERVDQGGQEF
jgi:hypothetical protein